MKLWNLGIRNFKGINDFKVYHFSSVAIKKINNSANTKNKIKSKASKLFLLKWGISIKFFKKYYLKTNTIYNGPLKEPKKDISYVMSYILCKVYFFYIKFFYKHPSFEEK